MKRVLITGAGGGVGGFLIDELKTDHDLIALDRVPPHDGSIVFIEGDVTDRDVVVAASAGVDAVIHLAAVLRIEDGPDGLPTVTDPEEHEHINIGGTRMILEAAVTSGIERVIFAGSDSAYGFVFAEDPAQPDRLPIDESHPLRARDPYGRSKAAGEELCRTFCENHDLNIVALRCCLIAFPDFYDGLARTRELGFLNHKRNWGYVDVRDVCSAYRLALEAETRGFEAVGISASDTYAEIPTRDLLASEYANVPIADDFPPETYAALFATQKAERALGFRPRFSCRATESR